MSKPRYGFQRDTGASELLVLEKYWQYYSSITVFFQNYFLKNWPGERGPYALASSSDGVGDWPTRGVLLAAGRAGP